MKKGFSIIEIIVTIVLLSLIFATVPMLLEAANRSDADSLEGEALYHASALVNRIAAMPYNSALLDGNETRMLDFGGATGCGYVINGLSVRRGTFDLMPPQFRSCAREGGTVIAPHIHSDTTPKRAINQFQGYTQDLTDRRFTLNVTIDDFNPPNNSVWSDYPSAGKTGGADMVLITVEAVSTDTGTSIGMLRYIAANIGVPQ